MPRIVLPLPQETYDKLLEDAVREFRYPKEHAIYLIQVMLGLRKDERSKRPYLKREED